MAYVHDKFSIGDMNRTRSVVSVHNSHTFLKGECSFERSSQPPSQILLCKMSIVYISLLRTHQLILLYLMLLNLILQRKVAETSWALIRNRASLLY